METQDTKATGEIVNERAPVAAKRPIDRLTAMLSTESVERQFKNALQDSASLFIASLIDLYGADVSLQKCEPKDVVMEALKAATLKLLINKALGFAYIVPFKNKQGKYIPTFMIGYRGYIQLAMRTGHYRHINADVVYEGELKSADKLTGHIDLSGEKTSDKVVGYFAHITTLNGFEKTVYITRADVEKHAKRFSASFGSASSPWKTDFDAMATKTALRKLLGKYGIMSVETQGAFIQDFDGTEHPEAIEIDDVIDIEAGDEPEEISEGPGF